LKWEIAHLTNKNPAFQRMKYYIPDGEKWKEEKACINIAKDEIAMAERKG
jgi:hypothetical protein